MSCAVVSSSIKNQVETVLCASNYFPTRIRCIQAEQGKIILQGNVQSYFQKQRAQEMIRKLDCVEKIMNELEVI